MAIKLNVSKTLKENVSVKTEKLKWYNIRVKKLGKIITISGIAPISPNSQDAQTFLEENLEQSNHF